MTMASTTRFSPSSYPTLSFQVGSDTEMACGVNAGTDAPSAIGASSVSVCVVLIVHAIEERAKEARNLRLYNRKSEMTRPIRTITRRPHVSPYQSGSALRCLLILGAEQ